MLALNANAMQSTGWLETVFGVDSSSHTLTDGSAGSCQCARINILERLLGLEAWIVSLLCPCYYTLCLYAAGEARVGTLVGFFCCPSANKINPIQRDRIHKPCRRALSVNTISSCYEHSRSLGYFSISALEANLLQAALGNGSRSWFSCGIAR